MPRAGFEHTIPVLERAKMFYALDRAAILIGYVFIISGISICSVKHENIVASDASQRI
jgi:hypothetical protein